MPPAIDDKKQSSPGNAIEVRGLVSRFGETVIHDQLDLDVRRGEILGVVGGSGTGKSVLLRSIIGLRRPSAGRIRLLGQDPQALEGEARRALERRAGVLFQDGALFSSLTVLENIQLPIKEVSRMPRDMLEGVAYLKLKLAGLPPEAGRKYPSELSGGMRKRAALARALALDPELLFLDEPTAGLDPIAAASFDALVRDLNAALGVTIFLVTHDLDTLYTACDRVAVLAQKRVLFTGPLDQAARIDHPWVRDYFTGPRGRAASHQHALVQTGAGQTGATSADKPTSA